MAEYEAPTNKNAEQLQEEIDKMEEEIKTTADEGKRTLLRGKIRERDAQLKKITGKHIKPTDDGIQMGNV